MSSQHLKRSSNLARFDGIRYGHSAEDVHDLEELYARSRSEGFGDEVKKRILFGTYALGAAHHEDVYRESTKSPYNDCTRFCTSI